MLQGLWASCKAGSRNYWGEHIFGVYREWALTLSVRTHVLKGKYPAELIQEWNAYDERKGSESISPAVFPRSQYYVVIVLPHGGSDLEAQDFMKLSSRYNSIYLAARKGGARKSTAGGDSQSGPWQMCASVFWQVCKSLAVAEESVEFEVSSKVEHPVCFSHYCLSSIAICTGARS